MVVHAMASDSGNSPRMMSCFRVIEYGRRWDSVPGCGVAASRGIVKLERRLVAGHPSYPLQYNCNEEPPVESG